MTLRAAQNPARHADILECAERLFIDLGFRAFTMERLVKETGLAKATVYAYVADKDDVFRQVAEGLAARMLAGASQALAAGGGLTERLCQALGAKHAVAFATVRRSPHATELFTAKNSLVREQFRVSDAKIVALMAKTIAAETIAGPTRGKRARNALDHLAQLIFDAATGLFNAAASPEPLQRDLRLLVERLLAPELDS